MVYDGVYNPAGSRCYTSAVCNCCANADTCSGCGPDTNTWCDCDANANSHADADADASFDSVVR
jgi:hypothetical protein